jgi:hypothetical protein
MYAERLTDYTCFQTGNHSARDRLAPIPERELRLKTMCLSSHLPRGRRIDAGSQLNGDAIPSLYEAVCEPMFWLCRVGSPSPQSGWRAFVYPGL